VNRAGRRRRPVLDADGEGEASRRPQEDPTVPVSTTATSGTLGSATTEGARGHRRGHGGFEKTFSAVADTLKMSTDDVKKDLAAGKSLTDIASAAGVSKDDLVSTIASTLPSSTPDGALVDTTAIATRMADSTRNAPLPGPSAAAGARGGSDLGKGIDTLASALGISSDDLLQRLTDGSGISDLLTSNPAVSSQLSDLQNKGALVDGYA
jgi:uncharacterized protein YidB (DUF937 family)